MWDCKVQLELTVFMRLTSESRWQERCAWGKLLQLWVPQENDAWNTCIQSCVRRGRKKRQDKYFLKKKISSELIKTCELNILIIHFEVLWKSPSAFWCSAANRHCICPETRFHTMISPSWLLVARREGGHCTTHRIFSLWPFIWGEIDDGSPNCKNNLRCTVLFWGISAKSGHAR